MIANKFSEKKHVSSANFWGTFEIHLIFPTFMGYFIPHVSYINLMI
jgi:hypothetical protein